MANSGASTSLLPKRRSLLSWLLQPDFKAVVFAFRTTMAACLALGVALWMELDSPAWAAMTVWSVAQLTRGESLSKARWRIVGTLIGSTAGIGLHALVPQAPWLFFPLLAIWVGVCSGLATFVSNFRAYALVLAGYTCAIVATDAAPDGNHVFMIAVSRGSYIILGVICETLVAFVFSPNQILLAHRALKQTLQSALIVATTTLASILRRGTAAENMARQQFGTMLRIADRIEFAEIEMGPHGHEGDHARAALAAISVLLARGFGIASQLHLFARHHSDYQTVADEVLNFLDAFPKVISDESLLPDLLSELQHLRDICRQYAAPHRLSPTHLVSHPSELTSDEVARMKAENTTETTVPELDERVLFVSLGELLGDLERAILEYYASTHLIRGDHFHFQRQTHRDSRLALNNGVRASMAVILTALIYEVTAWTEGFHFIGIASLCVGLYATQENPVLGTLNFLRGVVTGYVVAFFLVFLFMPIVKVYEPLILILSCAMMIGGLAKAHAATAAWGAAYSLLMPSMLGLSNHHVMNEMQFFNGNMATVLAAALAVIIFRTILPFSAASERFRLRKGMLRELRHLAQPGRLPSINAWVAHGMDRFSCILRHAGNTPPQIIEAFIRGTLATLTLGLNIIRLRTLMDREYLPESARRPIALVLHYIEFPTRRYAQAAQAATMAIRRLREMDTPSHDIITRLEITRAITYLMIIAHILRTNRNFLDPTKPFTGEELSTPSPADKPAPGKIQAAQQPG
ncbi:FUSC family protein [Oecophyllibacter saccharovorans]|uniref:FUSC family protein n=1 Tax=Oecophyllibacter saccharovorans TaxID=2558360 RepID=A0A506UR88_9PROT|nr:FUSC family protein [Oecophyllibacter saccharovorans]TPW34852.1 FUSC family protein [Oecophyllibacter saccharovorans]TPW35789.1 FUSC family protein [Oecophyllibacter saccharovorans]